MINHLFEQTRGRILCRSRRGFAAGLSLLVATGRYVRQGRLGRWGEGGGLRDGGQLPALRRSANIPCSANACTISSMKKGLPSVLSRMNFFRTVEAQSLPRPFSPCRERTFFLPVAPSASLRHRSVPTDQAAVACNTSCSPTHAGIRDGS